MHGWEIHPSIAPEQEDRIVYKRNSSGFDDTDLHPVLLELGVESVITCGIWSEFCVTNTSMAAIDLGLEVHIAADAHGTVSNTDAQASDVISRQNDYLKRHQARVAAVEDLRTALELA
jgi:nicotinamidase-related amidase